MAAYTADVDLPRTILKLLQKITYKNNIANKYIFNKVKFHTKKTYVHYHSCNKCLEGSLSSV